MQQLQNGPIHPPFHDPHITRCVVHRLLYPGTVDPLFREFLCVDPPTRRTIIAGDLGRPARRRDEDAQKAERGEEEKFLEGQQVLRPPRRSGTTTRRRKIHNVALRNHALHSLYSPSLDLPDSFLRDAHEGRYPLRFVQTGHQYKGQL